MRAWLPSGSSHFEHIRGAVLHHIYEEEDTWFLELTEKVGATDGRRLKDRYLAEFQRQYAGIRAPAD